MEAKCPSEAALPGRCSIVIAEHSWPLWWAAFTGFIPRCPTFSHTVTFSLKALYLTPSVCFSQTGMKSYRAWQSSSSSPRNVTTCGGFQPFQAPSPPALPVFANSIRTPFSLKETAPNAPLRRYKYSLSIGHAHTSIFVWLLFHLHLLSQAFRVLFISVGFKKKRMKVLLFRMTTGTYFEPEARYACMMITQECVSQQFGRSCVTIFILFYFYFFPE